MVGDSETTWGSPVRPFSPNYSGFVAKILNRIPTSTKLTLSPTPSCQGMEVTMTARVTSAAGTPTGSVVFYDGPTRLGSCSIGDSGMADFSSQIFAGGSHTFSCTYAGDSDFNGSTSPLVIQIVNSLPEIISPPQELTISPGQTATLTISASSGSSLHYHWYQGITGNTSDSVGEDAPSYTTPPLSSDARFWVRVTNDCGFTDSPTAKVRIFCPILGAPTLSVPNHAESGTVYSVLWTATSPDGTYELQESLLPSFSDSAIMPINGESSPLSHTVAKYTYFYYHVRATTACNGTQHSPWSAICHIGVGSETQQPADLDGDGLITSTDCLLLCDFLAGNINPPSSGDLNGDERIDSLDLVFLQNFLASNFR